MILEPKIIITEILPVHRIHNMETREILKKFRKTLKGVLTNMYDHMRRRHPVEFSLKEFQEMYLNDPKYIRLFDEWVKSGCSKLKKPSLDRINSKKGYVLGNIQMMTWEENRFKQNMERRIRKGAVLQLKDGFVIKRYRSQKNAVQETGLNQGLISSVLNGKRNHTGGYQWKYENPELITSSKK